MANETNMFSLSRNADSMKSFMESAIKSYNTVIEHYDFVINDISSDISNPKLEATKKPVLDFLKELRNEWISCRDDALARLNNL